MQDKSQSAELCQGLLGCTLKNSWLKNSWHQYWGRDLTCVLVRADLLEDRQAMGLEAGAGTTLCHRYWWSCRPVLSGEGWEQACQSAFCAAGGADKTDNGALVMWDRSQLSGICVGHS